MIDLNSIARAKLLKEQAEKRAQIEKLYRKLRTMVHEGAKQQARRTIANLRSEIVLADLMLEELG